MSEQSLLRLVEDIHNGMVDIYKYLDGKIEFSRTANMPLLICPAILNKAIRQFESESDSAEREIAQNAVLDAIDTGEFFIETLRKLKDIKEKQAAPVLKDLESLRRLVSVGNKYTREQ